MSNSVLDASALLAYLRDEPGALLVEVALANGAAMSAVNWAEVLSKVAEVDQPQTFIEAMRNQGILGQQLQIHGFSTEDALVIALLRPLTKSIGLIIRRSRLLSPRPTPRGSSSDRRSHLGRSRYRRYCAGNPIIADNRKMT